MNGLVLLCFLLDSSYCPAYFSYSYFLFLRWKFIMLFCRCSQCLHSHHSSLLLPRVLVSPGLCSYSSSSLGKHMMIVLLHNSILKKKPDGIQSHVCKHMKTVMIGQCEYFYHLSEIQHSPQPNNYNVGGVLCAQVFPHITGGNHSHTTSLHCS